MNELLGKLFRFVLNAAMYVTYPIYILLLITLWKYRKEDTLQHSFFKLIFSVGIADIGVITTIFYSQVASWGWFPGFFIRLDGMSSRIFYFFNYFFFMAQTLGVFVVAVNRFTAFMAPLHHQKIWRHGNVLIAAIVAQWIISFLSVTPIISYYHFRINVDTDNKTVYLQWTDAYQLLYYAIPTTIAGKSILIIIMFIFYGIIFSAAFKSNRLGNMMTNVEKTALKMSIVGFFHSIGLAIYLVNYIAEEVAWFGFRYNLWDINTNWLIMNLGQDLFSTVTPYSLLIFSMPVREHFFKMYRVPCQKLISKLKKTAKVIPVQDIPRERTRNGNQNEPYVVEANK